MVLRALVAVWIAVAIVSESAPARADAAEVEALIAKGNELRRAGTPGPALPYFQKAYELARTPRTTGQLGLAELAAGYPVEAEAHLSAALASPNDPSIVKYRQMLADALTMARSQIGELTIQGNPPGAEVVVNGRSVGALPLPSPIKLPARNTEVVVRAPGYSDQREIVPIAGGQRHALTVNLKSTEKPAAPAPTVVVPPPPPVSAPLRRPRRRPRRAATTSSSSVRRAAPHPAPACEPRRGSSGAARSWPRAPASPCSSPPARRSDVNSACDDHGDPLSPSCRIATTPGIRRRWSIVGYVSGAALAVTSASSSGPHAPVAGRDRPRPLPVRAEPHRHRLPGRLLMRRARRTPAARRRRGCYGTRPDRLTARRRRRSGGGTAGAQGGTGATPGRGRIGRRRRRDRRTQAAASGANGQAGTGGGSGGSGAAGTAGAQARVRCSSVGRAS